MPLRKQQLPIALTTLRAALGPLLIVGESCHWNGLTLAAMVLSALLSDIFDGILARRWQCDTPLVRLYDSMADTLFYLCVAAALWLGIPTLWHANGILLLALLSLEAIRFAVDYARFGKPASYHSYLAKTWGLVMAAAVITAFALHRNNILIPTALILGIACDLEGLTMSFLLPIWQKDVKTLNTALALRRQLLQPRKCPPILSSTSAEPSRIGYPSNSLS